MTRLTARRYRRLLAEIRAAAREQPPGTRLTSAALAARRAGIPALTVARASMASPRALAVAELALFGQCRYPASLTEEP